MLVYPISIGFAYDKTSRELCIVKNALGNLYWMKEGGSRIFEVDIMWLISLMTQEV